MTIVDEAPATGSVTENTEEAGGWLLLATICLAPLVAFLLAVALSPFFPVVAAELGTTVALLGQVTAVSMLGAAALGLLVGPLADHYGHRRLLLLGLLAVVVSALGTALAPTFALLLLAALAGAVSRAIVQPVSLAVAGERFRGAARRRAISWAVAATAGAAIVGTPAMTSIGAAFGWRAAFVVLGMAALTVAALALRALPLDAAPARRVPRLGAVRSASGSPRLGDVLAAYAPLLHHSPTLGLVGSSLLRSAAAWGWFTYYGAYLVEHHHLSLQRAGLAYTGVGLGFFAGSLVANGPIRHVPPRPLLVAISTLLGLLIAGATLLPVGALVEVAAISASAMMMGLGNVVATMLLTTESPAGRATTMTLHQSAFSVGSAAGSAVGGLLLALSGYHAIAVSVPVFCCAAALLVWLSRPRALVAVPAPVAPPAAGG